MSIKSLAAQLFAKIIHNKTQKWASNPVAAQQKVFEDLIRQAKNTQFGKDHQFSQIKTPKDFAKTGIAGMTMPKPTATKKDAATRIETSRGRSLNGDRINPESLLRLHHVQLRTPC